MLVIAVVGVVLMYALALWVVGAFDRVVLA